MDKQKEALKMVQENRLEAAVKLYIEYTEEHPADPVGYTNVGNILLQLQQGEEAERFYLKAIELDQKMATAYYGLGNLYYKQAIYEQADKMFTHSLSLGLEEADVYYLLGMTHVKREQWMLAIPFLQRATELENNETYLFEYGLALAKMNYQKEAATIFVKVLDIESGHADALYNLGILAFHEEELTKALHYFEKTIAIQTNHTMAQQAKKYVVEKLYRDEQ